MPNLSSPIATPAGMPVVNRGSVSRTAGFKCLTRAEFDQAMIDERADPLWVDGERLAIASESDSRAVRIWRTGLNHARTVEVESLQFVLDADDDKVLFAAGQPAGGTGAVGDVSVDLVGRMVYKKTGASTWVARYKLNVVVPVATTLTGAATLPLSAMNCMTPVNTASAVALTLPPASEAFALQPFGVIMVFVLGNGVPTFTAAGSDTIGTNANAAAGVKNSIMAMMVKSATEWVAQ